MKQMQLFLTMTAGDEHRADDMFLNCTAEYKAPSGVKRLYRCLLGNAEKSAVTPERVTRIFVTATN